MSNEPEKEADEIPDAAVIQFGNYTYRLVFSTFVKRNQHHKFPMSTKFSEVLKRLEVLECYRILV